MANKRVLVSSIIPGGGGVHSMNGFIVGLLLKYGLDPVIAHYEPYSMSPHLSVPCFKLFQRQVSSQQRLSFKSCETHAIGAWLPELEFTHYHASSQWREVMDSCQAFVVVSGNVLAATPYQQTGRPYLAWVATDWEGDRKERAQSFPFPRKVLDKAINGPLIRRLEKKLLHSGRILALSQYTAQTLTDLAGTESMIQVLPMPIDSSLFVPDPAATMPLHIGFTGRFDDPRKNIGLMLKAMSLLKKRGLQVRASLIGVEATNSVSELIKQLGLEDQIICLPRLVGTEFIRQVQALDVFILPSHQEGLCISALEAMSCGVPVVSTRCGGPEEFVIDDLTGKLVGFDANLMANAIGEIVTDRAMRDRLSQGARKIVMERYALEHAEHIFMDALKKTFPQLL